MNENRIVEQNLLRRLRVEGAAETLPLIADLVDARYFRMISGDMLTYGSEAERFVMYHHEVPGLAMLFRNSAVSQELGEVAVSRAEAYLATAVISEARA